MSIRPIAIGVAVLLLALPLTHAQNNTSNGPPANCTPVSLSAYAVYNEQRTRAVWDAYSVDSRGVCEWRTSSGPNTMPSCRYGVQLSHWSIGWYGILCFWGTPGQALRTNVAPRDLQEILNDILGMPEVQKRLGTGRLVLQLDIGGDIVTIVTQNGLVATIDGKLVAPPKCYTTYLGGYREYSDPVVKRTWDAYSADSVAVCRWDPPDRPTQECNHMVEMGNSMPGVPPFWLCWWGKLVGIQQAGVSLEPDVEISMSRDAWLSVANVETPGEMLLRLYREGYVAIKFRDPAKQAAMKLGGKIALAGETPVPAPRGALATLPREALIDNKFGAPIGVVIQHPWGPNGLWDRDPTVNKPYVDLSLLVRISDNANVGLADPLATPRDKALMWFTEVLTGSDEEWMSELPHHREWRERARGATIDPYGEPGRGAGWIAPSPADPKAAEEEEEGSVLDEIDEVIHLAFREGARAAKPPLAPIDEWAHGGEVA